MNSAIFAPAIGMVTTGNGGTDGYVTVADNSGVYPGQKGWINNGGVKKYVLVTDLSGTTKVGLRYIGKLVLSEGVLMETDKSIDVPATYGRTDMTAFTTGCASSMATPATAKAFG